MAIKKGLNQRLAEIGKIKIGGKGAEKITKKDGKEKKWRLPIKFDFFKVTTTERDNEGNFVLDPDVMGEKGVGDEPKELSIKLPFDDVDMNFFTSFQLYHKAALKCKGDGESAQRTDKDGNTKEIECNTETCEYMESGKCKVSGILSCYLTASPSYGGVYRFRTHSWNSVSNILAALEEFKRNTGGILQGIPMKLKMLKKATTDHGNVNTVTIVLDGIEINKMREYAFREEQSRLKIGFDMKAVEAEAVAAGFKTDNDEPGEIEAEFYTETDQDEVDQPGTTSDEVKDQISDDDDNGDTEPPEEKTEKDLF